MTVVEKCVLHVVLTITRGLRPEDQGKTRHLEVEISEYENKKGK